MPELETAHLHEAYAKARIILEYGSGGSTVWAARQPNKLIFSVESDRNWATDLQNKLDQSDLPSPAIIYYADIGPTGAWGRAVDDTEWKKFHRYPTAIWSEPFFRHPDLILIDGRFRPACLVNACLRITRPVTVLFDDYTNRPAYHVVEKLIKPRQLIGRMAEFHLEPQDWPSWTPDFLIGLCNEATYSSQKKIKYK